MRIRAVIFLLSFVLLFCTVAAQTTSPHTSLTTVLNQISDKYGVKLSFSPNLTENVFPGNTQTGGDIETALQQVLKGTNFTFKKMKDKMYYIYKQAETKAPAKPAVRKPVPPKKIEPKPDTMRLHTVVIPISDSIEPILTYKLKRPVITLRDLPQITLATEQSAGKTPLPLLAVKSNLLYDATTTMNLGVEFGLAPKWTLDISGNYNPWTFSGNRKMKHWLIQPEARYWLCQRFSGHFFGLHGHYAQYNMGGMLPWGFNTGKMFGSIKSDNMLNHRYEGWLAGAGISYGYHWVLGNRWGLEATVGVGYAYLKYDKYPCEHCGRKIATESKHYFGPTKAAVSLIFMIE